MNFRHIEWDISFLERCEVVRSESFGISREAKSVRYPIRLLRYWFGYHLLREEYQQRSVSLDVCEVGVDTGQMLRFAQSARKLTGDPVEWKLWTAVDAFIQQDRLAEAGYKDWMEINLEKGDLPFEGNYDMAILLHVLEHLSDPEAAMRKIARAMRPGGAIIGGFPVVPHLLISLREEQLRQTAGPMGHVSVFSPERVDSMAKQAGLQVEFVTGAYLMRSKGSWLENYPGWMRFNIAFGSMFHNWPGEIYWLMRKPLA